MAAGLGFDIKVKDFADDEQYIEEVKLLAKVRDEVVKDARIPLKLFDEIIEGLGYSLDDLWEYRA